MKIALYSSRPEYLSDERIIALIASLKSAGNEVLDASGKDILEDGTDMLLSIGGDGTFLSASALAVASSVPVAGVILDDEHRAHAPLLAADHRAKVGVIDISAFDHCFFTLRLNSRPLHHM